MVIKMIKRMHVSVLILGAVIFALASINGNVWFDECYSIAAVSGSIAEMPSVLTDDVHPFLYYFMLKLAHVLTGGSLVAMRLFSALGMWLLGFAGYTHVRRYVSEKAGLLFSFFCYVLPASVKYAGEIRMYSFGALFVFFSAFYAFICIREGMASRKHCVYFVISSVAAAYMHYYGLVTVCVINAFFLVGAIITKTKARRVIACAASELLMYVPGAVVFLIQSTRVAAGDYWIRVKYPDVLVQTVSYAYAGGDSPWDCYMSTPLFTAVTVVSCVLFVLAVAVIIYSLYKREESALFGALALGVFLGVVGAGLAVSVFKEFYYVRYTMLPYGLLILAYAYAASRIDRKLITSALCVLLVAVSAVVNVPFFAAMHNGDFGNVSETLNAEFADSDVFVFGALTPGSVVSYMLDGERQYFVNEDIEEYPRAYTAFNAFETVPDFESLPDDIHGRIWLLVQDYNEEELTELLEARYTDAERVDELYLSVLYRHNDFKFVIYNTEG